MEKETSNLYSSHHGSRHHHHKSKKYKYYHKGDSSSAMERRGENIIYNNVRREKIALMIKRTIFIFIIVSLFIFSIYSIFFNDTSYKSDGRLFDKGISEQEVNDLKNKITDYEFYIEELENRLSKYESVDSILK